MRKPLTVERLYLDFDGFFAAVEQWANPQLRGRPVGVVPFAGAENSGILIACSREAKVAGVKSVMRVKDAKHVCPHLITVPQSPDLYRRAHNRLVAEISAVLPIDAVKSIDELTCRLSPAQMADPAGLARRLKQRLRDSAGSAISCSIGIAANRLLAKMACKLGKKSVAGVYGNGCTIWHPGMMPGPLLKLELADVPGIGSGMAKRLSEQFRIYDMAALLATQPKQLRKMWHNVTGERLWYALHGYDIQAQPQARGMYGHGRVLPPRHRGLAQAREASRLLLVKAARRLRRDQWRAGRLWLYLALKGPAWQSSWPLADVQDDHAVLHALEALWQQAFARLKEEMVFRVHVALLDLTPAHIRQLDFLGDDEPKRQKWEQATLAMDGVNRRYGRTLVSVGTWLPPPGGYAGGKISYTRIPQAEDFF